MSPPLDVLLGIPIDCSGAFIGCERMPAALRAADIARALSIADAGNLQVTIADPVRDPKTGVIGLRDVLAASNVIRANLAHVLTHGQRPLLLGGDCTLLIGVAAALLESRPRAGLVFLDGHLDCHDGATSPTGECADMELAILLGVGPEPLVNLARRQPMIEPDRVVVLGPSEEQIATPGSRPDPRKFAPSMRIVGLDELASDPGRHAREALDHLRSAANGYWLHLDLDVLSCSQLPAVDYPTEDGLSWQALEEIVHPALTDPGLIGASVVILNPVKDPDGRYAARVVKLLRHSIIRSNIPESA